jgi:hypothetical protein
MEDPQMPSGQTKPSRLVAASYVYFFLVNNDNIFQKCDLSASVILYENLWKFFDKKVCSQLRRSLERQNSLV